MSQPEFHDCGAHVVYSVRWDTFYCPACNEWLEPLACDDESGREFCEGRPEKPLEESK